MVAAYRPPPPIFEPPTGVLPAGGRQAQASAYPRRRSGRRLPLKYARRLYTGRAARLLCALATLLVLLLPTDGAGADVDHPRQQLRPDLC